MPRSKRSDDWRNWRNLQRFAGKHFSSSIAVESVAAYPIPACPCRKLKLEHIDGVAHPGLAVKARGLFGTHPSESARLCAATGASCPRCNIFGKMQERGVDGARQRRRRDQDIPVGSSRSASPHTRSAKATAPRPVGRECPWPVLGADVTRTRADVRAIGALSHRCGC